MNSQLYNQLISGQIYSQLKMLDTALEEHHRWLANIMLNLTFNTPPSKNDLSEDAHYKCAFGTWYKQFHDKDLARLPEFQAIGAIHQKMHAKTREIIQRKQQKVAPKLDEFQSILNLSKELRNSVAQLKEAIKSDLYQTARLLIEVFDKTSEAVMISDPAARIINVNAAFSQITGYTAAEVMGKNPSLLRSGRQDALFYEKFWDALNTTGEWQGEIWNRRKCGEVYLQWLSVSAIYNQLGEVHCYVGIISHIRAENEHQQWLYQQAHTDPLTGLANRIVLNDRLFHAMAQGRRDQQSVSVMFLDLDGFKQTNDKLGHQFGDQLLCKVAERLQGAVRETDTVARFGGDEFVIVMPHSSRTTLAEIETMAKKLVTLVALPYNVKDREYTISTSMGISLFPNHGEDADKLLHYADCALYTAKSSGKNAYHFHSPD
ncbi:MAG: diguanylate cyclase [Sedimenticola sp.]